MKVNYKPPSIIDKLDTAIEESMQNKKRISSVELTKEELEEFCNAFGYAYAEGCGYTYKHIHIKYDWGRYK